MTIKIIYNIIINMVEELFEGITNEEHAETEIEPKKKIKVNYNIGKSCIW